MTWKEVKEEIERNGVTDDMELDYIDISYEILGVKTDKKDNSFTVW